ncbi:MAG: hypothetical protein HY738_10515 [Bacteroidia bacterium]|nr:hypothetical protein [Bacteroidia bacterium]
MSKKNKYYPRKEKEFYNIVKEPEINYGNEPLSYEKILYMFQETDKKFQETREQMKETDRKLNKLGELYGNIGHNNADVTESFFYNGLKKKKKIGGFEYKYIDRNIQRRKNRIEKEYDIVLYNDNKLLVIEVKYKFHPDDVENFITNKLSFFKILYDNYKEHDIYGCIASFDIPEATKEIALKYGLLILQPSGDNIDVANNIDFILKKY